MFCKNKFFMVILWYINEKIVKLYYVQFYVKFHLRNRHLSREQVYKGLTIIVLQIIAKLSSILSQQTLRKTEWM